MKGNDSAILMAAVLLASGELAWGEALAQPTQPEGRAGVTRPAEPGRTGVTRPAETPHEHVHEQPKAGGSAAPS